MTEEQPPPEESESLPMLGLIPMPPASAFNASRVAQEYANLPERVRSDIGLPAALLYVLDGAVMAAKALLDQADTRHWAVKLEGVMDAFEEVGTTHGQKIASYILTLDEEGMRRLVEKHFRAGYVDHVHRMIGEAAFHRLKVAVTHDVDGLAAAAFKGVEMAMPYAQALGDMAEIVPAEEVDKVLGFNPANGLVIEMALGLLDALNIAIDKISVAEHLVHLPAVREAAPTASDLIQFTAELRITIAGQSRDLLQDVSSVLERKLRGAKDALAHSADSVSQAANSLVEFIDRLMRAAFTEDDVLAWLADNYTGVPDLTYTDKNADRVRPTKRAQALCLMHGGQKVDQPSPVHLLAATSINLTRRQLQKLKHSDEGTPEELERIEMCLVAVEGFVQVGCRMAWAFLSDEALTALTERLDPARAAERRKAIEAVAPGKIA